MVRPVAVVTGAAHGIGHAAARRQADTHDVALLDLDGDGAAAAAAALGGRALGLACDITDPAAIQAAADTVREAFGGVDVVVANAGVALTGSLRHLDPAVLEAQVGVNLTGSWRSIHAFLPMVIERRGYVLGVASVSALLQAPGIGAYAASKAGFEALLRTLRQDVAHLGVDVGIAYFHWIDTDMVRGAERDSPDFAELRAQMRGPAGRTLPVAAAGDAIARGVVARAPRVVAPRWVGVLDRLRGVVAPLADLQGRRVGAQVDRITAEHVRERGALAGALRRDHAGSQAAVRSIGR
jgi:NAD(P)-dependent dehydrogenase (short-subunit alcohol dehydrogenase family)